MLSYDVIAGYIIHGITEAGYIDASGNTITESILAGLNSKDYSVNGYTADGNTRLILRVQSTKAEL